MAAVEPRARPEDSPLTVPCAGGDDLLLTDLIETGEELIDPHSLRTLLDSMGDSGCWGMQLSGRECTPGFQVGQGHFKNKFCTHCRQHGLSIAARRVRLATPALFKNTNGRSAWTAGSRVVNQTAKCIGPSAIIFKEEVPDELELSGAATACPREWLRTHAATGEEYVGEFTNGEREGEGSLIDAAGRVVHQGRWSGGEFVGA